MIMLQRDCVRFRVIDRGKSGARLPILTCPCSNGKASGIPSGLCLHGKSNRRSRVVDVRILEGSVVDRTRQGVRDCSTMCENVKLQIDESREDSTEAVSRMEDGNTPVGGPLVPAEVSSRSEGVPPSRKRESEKRGALGDLTLECTDGVGNVHQGDDSDPYVAGCDDSEFQSGRIVLQKRIW